MTEADDFETRLEALLDAHFAELREVTRYWFDRFDAKLDRIEQHTREINACMDRIEAEIEGMRRDRQKRLGLIDEAAP